MAVNLNPFFNKELNEEIFTDYQPKDLYSMNQASFEQMNAMLEQQSSVKKFLLKSLKEKIPDQKFDIKKLNIDDPSKSVEFNRIENRFPVIN